MPITVALLSSTLTYNSTLTKTLLLTPVISFEAHEVPIPDLNYDEIIVWLTNVANEEDKSLASLDYIFCNDQYLHKINHDYLAHDTYTDIITFPYSYNPIESEIYISLDRVRENAKTFGDGEMRAELLRVIVHGLLHMCGYCDHTDKEKELMRRVETKYLTQV